MPCLAVTMAVPQMDPEQCLASVTRGTWVSYRFSLLMNGQDFEAEIPASPSQTPPYRARRWAAPSQRSESPTTPVRDETAVGMGV